MFQAIFLAAVLTGTPVVPEYFCETVEVKVLWYPDWVALNVAYPGQFYPDGVEGFARLLENCTCEIHALEPKKVMGARAAVVGHEFLHCIWGYFHE